MSVHKVRIFTKCEFLGLHVEKKPCCSIRAFKQLLHHMVIFSDSSSHCLVWPSLYFNTSTSISVFLFFHFLHTTSTVSRGGIKCVKLNLSQVWLLITVQWVIFSTLRTIDAEQLDRQRRWKRGDFASIMRHLQTRKSKDGATGLGDKDYSISFEISWYFLFCCCFYNT